MPDLLPPTASAPATAPAAPPTGRARTAQAAPGVASARRGHTAQGRAPAAFADALAEAGAADASTPVPSDTTRPATRGAKDAQPDVPPPVPALPESLPIPICVTPTVVPPQQEAWASVPDANEASVPVTLEHDAEGGNDTGEEPLSTSAAQDALAASPDGGDTIPAITTPVTADVPVPAPAQVQATGPSVADENQPSAEQFTPPLPGDAPRITGTRQAGVSAGHETARERPSAVDASAPAQATPRGSRVSPETTFDERLTAATTDAGAGSPATGAPSDATSTEAAPLPAAAKPAQASPRGAAHGDTSRAESRKAAQGALLTALDPAAQPVPATTGAPAAATTGAIRSASVPAHAQADPITPAAAATRVRAGRALSAEVTEPQAEQLAPPVSPVTLAAAPGSHASSSKDGRSSSESYASLRSLATPHGAATLHADAGAAPMAAAWASRMNEAAQGPAGAALTTADAEAWGVPDQIVRGLQVQLRSGTGEATIRLRPEHLGEIVVEMKVEAEGVVATLKSDTPAVRAWIAAHRDDLEAGLADAGLRLDDLRVSDREAGQERRERQADEAPRRRPRRAPESTARFEILA